MTLTSTPNQDPFWWSHAADGHCENGGSASANYDPSAYHYPAGMAAAGLDYQLLFSAIGSNNTYQKAWLARGESVIRC